jgi:glucose-6-phosphate 1-dehydrogenase
MRPLRAGDVVRGQYEGYRQEQGVSPTSQVETFAALRLSIDTWRWAGVPFFIRAGKCLPVTATEVLVALNPPPPTPVFDEVEPSHANYLRFRLSPDVFISLGARAKVPGEAMVGEEVELVARHQSPEEMTAYERLLGDALRGDQRAFAREDGVEAAWQVVDGVLGASAASPVYVYEPASWGPPEADRLVSPCWHNPTPPGVTP